MAYTIGGFTFVILTATMLLSAYDARLSAAIVRGADQLRQANEQLERRVRERTQTLASEEARKDAILRTALDCIISMDQRGSIAEWNPAAEGTFGYRRHEALGRPLDELILPERRREAFRANLARYLATGEARLIGRRIEATALRRACCRLLNQAEYSLAMFERRTPEASTRIASDQMSPYGRCTRETN